jgi:hypothetical protein
MPSMLSYSSSLTLKGLVSVVWRGQTEWQVDSLCAHLSDLSDVDHDERVDIGVLFLVETAIRERHDCGIGCMDRKCGGGVVTL